MTLLTQTDSVVGSDSVTTEETLTIFGDRSDVGIRCADPAY